MNEQKKVIKEGDDVVYTSVSGTPEYGVVVKVVAQGDVAYVVFKGETEAAVVFTEYLEVIDNRQFTITVDTPELTIAFSGNYYQIVRELDLDGDGLLTKMFEFCRRYELKEITVNGELKMTVEEV